ncbi:DNA adenine methylase [Haliscomenobacter hydrossis]|uniref:D12 class N6 adenine-specific DNA methyltransferase n=1 Tax=Haliscomenobacter hydrossis (strain ATCC 27775 / DSM 1100 / LMG 10767 / O) TaxID=760192 RepID=F4KYP0_HALH1|nr:DNA adenine methylase [Haliscomenobacter hydrossis]AEE50446.1 D12 class N6 adenine-specific DNA methyltransferase [Haliscomenobacter hydrossis DSM 1100]
MFDIDQVSSGQAIINVASVPQRSPFRYPGGKTWLIPTVRQWLKQENKITRELIEPFAGGGIVSLTAAFEKLAEQITMVEMDEEIAAVWEVILNEKNQWLADKIYTYDLTHANVKAELENPNKALQDVAFCTILKNRVFHGGILAKGSGMIKNGENGKGITSRWYPKTLRDRILAINFVKDKIKFIPGDAFEVLEQNIENKNAYFFIDPPYTVAGKRLYTYFDIDHERLFALTAQLQGKFMLTYDDTPEIRQLADKYRLQYRTIPMKTTLHFEKNEIIVSDNFEWWVEGKGR